ncbi:hypothetical protein CHR26_04135 [Pseudomonas putida]|nr:hypothetical protein CHR26_04135 [Pseudomonas putida]
MGCAVTQKTVITVGAGLPREWGHAVPDTGLAGVRGKTPLPQGFHGLQGLCLTAEALSPTALPVHTAPGR